jgi:glutathionylspermidine synthase
LLIRWRDWNQLQDLAEQLTAELLRAERELLFRPTLHGVLGVPRGIRRALRQIDRAGETAAAVRSMRFDFHWTREGWRISEVNSDVPGGFGEASALPRMMSELSPGTIPAGDAGGAWAEALSRGVREGTGDVALLTAPGFMEDHQVVSYLARQLRQIGFRSHLASPTQLRFDHLNRACLDTAYHTGPLAAVVRFYQAEWLTYLPRRCPWRRFFAGSTTPVANPGVAVLSESKRFPLVWDELRTPMPTWRRLLPESRDPRDAPWRRDDGWLLKTAFCNTGDTVTARDLSTPKQWRAAALSAWLNPTQWVAQRRFEPLSVPSPMGDVYPCIGVYTIDGHAVGAYTRIAPRPVIDYRAIDAALLVHDGEIEMETRP